MRRRPLTGVALALLLGACASSGGAEVVDDTVTAGSTSELAGAVGIDAALDGSVRVEASGCGPTERNGMATAIDDDLLVTAAHVVAGADTIAVIDSDGHRSAAEVVAFDPLLDIAALRALDTAAATVPISPVGAAADEVGAVVVSDVGGSLEWVEVTVVRRATIETTDIYRDTDVVRAGFEIEASIDPGDSGAAVHLPGGIAGIVWARSTVYPDRAWAIDIPDRFLDEVAVADSPVDTGPCP
jgi:S1-C subfamily serine protease